MAEFSSIGGVATANNVAIFPAGTLIDYLGDSAPVGFFPMDGRPVKQADYPELYAVIGNTYDDFDGATPPAADEFRIPKQSVDGLGLYMRGVGDSTSVGEYQVDVFKEHAHIINDFGGTASVESGSYTTTKNINTDVATATTNTGDSIETRPRSLTVLKCISAGRKIV